jgi:hypothetical protein
MCSLSESLSLFRCPILHTFSTHLPTYTAPTQQPHTPVPSIAHTHPNPPPQSQTTTLTSAPPTHNHFTHPNSLTDYRSFDSNAHAAPFPTPLPPSTSSQRPQYHHKTLPTTALLLSFVATFFKPFPAWICPSNAPISLGPALPAPAPAPGGGGGGATGAPPGGGGGGGGPLGAPSPGIGGAGGAGGGGGLAVSNPPVPEGVSGTGVAGLLPVSARSIALNGRGGAIVPNRIEASCFADPAPAGAGPSSSESSCSEPAADHSSSSSSGRRREVGFTASWAAMRWKGLVEGRSAGGGENGWVWGMGGGEKAGAAEASEERFLK